MKKEWRMISGLVIAMCLMLAGPAFAADYTPAVTSDLVQAIHDESPPGEGLHHDVVAVLASELPGSQQAHERSIVLTSPDGWGDIGGGSGGLLAFGEGAGLYPEPYT